MDTTQQAESGLPSRVLLVNTGEKSLSYTFDGTDVVVLEAGRSVELPRRKAIEMRGHHPGNDEMGNPLKWTLEIRPIGGDNTKLAANIEPEKEIVEKVVKIIVCPICAREFSGKGAKMAYSQHIKKCLKGEKDNDSSAGSNESTVSNT